jgi:isocitrate dehydrogenase (NAD+)
MTLDIAVVPGDGIGPEVTAAARAVLEATGVDLRWHVAEVGASAYAKSGTALPAESVEIVRSCGVVLKGPLINPTKASAYASPNMGLRAEFGMFANVRTCRYIAADSQAAAADRMDIAVVREMTEGILAGSGQWVGPDAAVAVSSITRSATERIAEFACQWATQRERKKITVVHKASILRYTDGLFLKVVQEVVERYPNLEFSEIMVDTAATQLLRRPADFDVIVTGSQYGDILSDVCGGVLGGPGVIPGSTYGDKAAFFESVHGAAPKYAGQDRANPIGMILSGAELLRHVGASAAADAVASAVRHVVREGRTLTPDLGGSSGTKAVTDAIAAAVTALPGLPGRVTQRRRVKRSRSRRSRPTHGAH